MIIRLPTRIYRCGESFPYLLMSDLHFGAAWCDRALIRSDLQWARKHNARIRIAGDVWDLILPKDRKRFVPSCLDPELRGKDNILNAALDLACRELGPYADLIEMIGCGNHETAITKHHGADMVALLIDRLSTPKHQIHHGGYTGAIVQHFRRKDGGGCRWVVWYHHGKGGAAPVSKGMIDFNRFSTYVRDADVLWCGHKHHRWVEDTSELRVPLTGNDFEIYPRKHIMTGAYDRGNHPQHDDDGNYVSDFATEGGFAPAGRGGIRLMVSIALTHNTPRPRTEVIL
jgi:hypothetical protein